MFVQGFLHQAFDLFDHDHNDRLSRAETYSMVSWLLRLTWSKPPTNGQIQEYVDKMFATLDTDQSGTLEENELIAGYLAFPAITESFEQLSMVSALHGSILAVPDVKEEKLNGTLGSHQVARENRACCAACVMQ